MGTMYQAECVCGYASGFLSEGCGMAGLSRDLGRCDHCQEMVSIPALSVRRRCPKCRRKVVVLKNVNTDDDETTRAGALAGLECPRCHQLTMRLEVAGVWD